MRFQVRLPVQAQCVSWEQVVAFVDICIPASHGETCIEFPAPRFDLVHMNPRWSSLNLSETSMLILWSHLCCFCYIYSNITKKILNPSVPCKAFLVAGFLEHAGSSCCCFPHCLNCSSTLIPLGRLRLLQPKTGAF